MSEWGIFTTTSETETVDKFAEYGITLTLGDPSAITFSDGKSCSFGSWYGASATGTFLVNDEKHVVIVYYNNSAPSSIPWDSTGGLWNHYVAGAVLESTDGDIVCAWGKGNSYNGVYGDFNIPSEKSSSDTSLNDLLIIPVYSRLATGSGSSYTGWYTWKDLYFSYDRQFSAGDIIVASNGDRYISMGGWFLFKM